MQPLVSVIVPAYNGDRYIAEAVESVLHQTYPHVELIVVDDGSTDRTQTVLAPYGDRIRYFYQTNQGVGSARNVGLEQAQGELIAFLDQDDVFLPEKLALQVSCLTALPHLGMVSSGWRITNAEGEAIAEIQPWQELPELTAANWVLWKPVFLGAMLFRREWLARSGGFNAQLQQTPDVELVLRLALMGCLAVWVRQVTVCYRQHAQNASRQALQQAKELETVLDQLFGQPLPPSIQQLEGRSRYQSLVWSAWRLYGMGSPLEAIAYLKKSLRYATGAPTATILDWIETFQRYAAEWGQPFNAYTLTDLPEWQRLTQDALT